jgi:predicted ATPase
MRCEALLAVVRGRDRGVSRARAWELRTAIDLARLWAKRGRPKDVRQLLQPILEQFTEGKDTADLQTAARLLAELSQDQ